VFSLPAARIAVVPIFIALSLTACSGAGSGTSAPSIPPMLSAPAPSASGAAAASASRSASAAPANAAPQATAADHLASNVTAIVNGQPWPSNFRPFAATSAVNTPLPATPANTDASSTSKMRAYLQHASNPFYGVDDQADGPVYAAHAGDPTVALSITQSNDKCPGQIQIPAQARAPGHGDSHMSVIEPDGSLYEFWLAKYAGGSTLSAAYCENVPGGITGPSLTPSGQGVTDGNSAIAELIRFDELTNGTIPHALRTVLPCVNGLQAPIGTSKGVECPDGMGVAMGTRFYLDLSDAEIDALPSSTIQPYMRPILHALHRYGAYVTDTGFFSPPESNNALNFVYESGLAYKAFGTTSPGAKFAASHGFANNGENWIDNNAIDWPSLAAHIVVVSNCYASGACGN
jgi:hypothetical protein